MTAISVYEPFNGVFPALVRGLFSDSEINAPAARGFRVDVRETPAGYVLNADLPGVRKEDIAVDIDGAQVTIRAEVQRAAAAKEGERVLRSERVSGKFARSFELPAELDEAQAIAKFEHGVLELTLPKKQGTAAKRLTIN
jgi:HSP20 family protein